MILNFKEIYQGIVDKYKIKRKLGEVEEYSNAHIDDLYKTEIKELMKEFYHNIDLCKFELKKHDDVDNGWEEIPKKGSGNSNAK